MKSLNEVLKKVYEKQTGAAAPRTTSSPDDSTVRGWARNLRQPVHARALTPDDSLTNEPAQHESTVIHLQKTAEPVKAAALMTAEGNDSPIHFESSPPLQVAVESSASPARTTSANHGVSENSIRIGPEEGTEWRIDQAHPSDTEAAVAASQKSASPQTVTADISVPPEKANEAVATVPIAIPIKGWKWPDISDRLLESPVGEELRRLADRLSKSAKCDEQRCLVFSGPGRNAGRTAVVATLAKTLIADQSQKIAIVDLNFDAPEMAAAFSLSITNGSESDLLDSRIDFPTATSRLSDQLILAPLAKVVPGDEIDSSVTASLQRLLQTLRRECDLVLIDAGAWDGAHLPTVLNCRAVDGFVSVARSRDAQTARSEANELIQFGIEWLGLIETFTTFSNA